VVENVPCPVGHVPEEWTHAIYAKLRQYGVDSAVIMAGLKLARSDGYVFDDSTVPTLTIRGPVYPINTGDKTSARTENPAQERKRTAEVLEWQYENAKNNNNYSEMRRLAQEFANLLNRSEPGWTPEEEMQWGTRLLRRAVVRMKDGSDPRPRGQGPGGGPYRTLYVPVNIVEGEGEGGREAE
jgi:hypothetical protein